MTVRGETGEREHSGVAVTLIGAESSNASVATEIRRGLRPLLTSYCRCASLFVGFLGCDFDVALVSSVAHLPRGYRHMLTCLPQGHVLGVAAPLAVAS